MSALTDVIAKQRLMRVLEGHGKVPARIDSAQHGLRPGRSCDTALFTVMSLIQRAMLTGKQLLIVFWDCRKCYPTTWRERLIVKLAELGIRGRLLNYLVHCGALDYERFVDQNQNQNQNLLTCTSGAVTTTSTRPHPFLGGEQ